MNHIYRSIWNEKTGTFVAVSENTKTGGKKASAGASVVVGAGFALKALAVSLMLAFGPNSYALPANGTVVAGSATITGSSNNMTINQSSQNAALNWQSFNIGTGEAVHFVQPNSNSVALNRVLGADPSSILGTLSANGKVFIVNPNGILFGKGASVNVGGLVASTRNISDSDFMAGNYKFAGAGNGSVLNQGMINADGGYVALLGANVSNEGTINARLGSVALAAGNAITLDVVGDGLLNVVVDQGAVNGLVQNGGMIQADGGQVLLTAQAAGNLLQTVVNNTGIIQAQTIENHNGTIKLLGDMQSGTVNVGGKLDASAPNGGNGGAIETSAAHVKVSDNARITTSAQQGLTGSWLIDPTDYTIASSGGDITGAALSTNLGSTDVTILSTSGGAGSNGDVNVNDNVTWSANKLTLNAQNNININRAMNGSGTASLALQYGQGAVAAGNVSTVNVHAAVNLPAGNNFSTTLGSDGVTVNYTVITSLGAASSTTGTDLQGMSGGLSGNYALGSNIDATATSAWNSGAGFAPVGTGGFMGSPFAGHFDGLGHTISNLTINLPSTDYVGLFSSTNSSSTISNVGLVGSSITGRGYVGELVGQSRSNVSNSYVTGTVTGSGNRVGGLMGDGQGGAIDGSYSAATISSSAAVVGGLVGGGGVNITNSYVTGAVTGGSYVGGLVGAHEGGTINNSYATGAVTGTSNNVGGLAGYIFANTINNTYATGAVSGGSNVGGLLGMRDEHGAGHSTIASSYWNSDVYATGIGFNYGVTTGTAGLTSAQMQTASNFSGFNFTTTAGATGNNWVMVDTDGSLNNAAGTTGTARPMLASEYSTNITNAHQLQLMAMDLSANYTLGQNISASTTGNSTDIWGGAGFRPVGNFTTKFSGTFDGLGHSISNLTINLPSTMFVGLFGAATGTLKNVSLVSENVTGNYGVGGLTGYTNSSISNSSVTGTVTGANLVGGLVGRDHGTTNNSFSTATVVASSNTGGGLIGKNYGTISSSYATGPVSGSQYNGGLVGINQGTISNSYAMGSVTGTSGSRHWSGGLVGINYNNINNSYATGTVIGGTGGTFGGLVGKNYGTVTKSFWDTTTSAQATSNGGLGMTTAQMMTQANFTGATAANGNVNPAWDVASTWVVYDTHTYPLLRSFMTPLTITANGASKTYDSVAYSGGNGVTYSVTPDGSLLGSISYTGSAQGAVNAGSYAITPGGFYSTGQQGYAITYVNGALTVNAANLTLSTSNVSKSYDGGLSAAGTAAVTSGTLFGSDSLSGGTFAFTDKNTGSGNKTVTASGITVNDGNSGGNYNVTFANNTTSTITAANLTLSTSNVSKSYDGGLSAAGTAAVTSGTLFGSDSLSGGTFAFTDKNTGSGNKTVTASGITVNDGNSGGNYNVTFANNTTSTITAANLTLSTSNVSKTYDGGLSAAGTTTVTSGTLFGSDSISGGTFAFTDKNVGSGNKTVTTSGVTVSDGNSGGNYNVSYANNTTSTITRLNSVTWTGGVNGNWFDPANWAGGAVPDLSNVANVVIPTGVIVSFNNGSVVSPAQAGTVNVDSIGGAGGMSLVGGNLSVVSSLQLASLDQSGGTFNSAGNVSVGSFNQTGGSVTNTGSFTATNSFSQSGGTLNGTLGAGGNVSITQASGSVTLGNLNAGGTLDVTAVSGDITQAAGTSIVSGGASTLAAPNGSVTLAASGNSFGTAIVSGSSITKIENAVANAISTTTVNAVTSPTNSSGDNLVSPLVTSSEGGPGVIGAIGVVGVTNATSVTGVTPIQNMLAGLNVTITGEGVNLPVGVQVSDGKKDDKN